MNPPIRPSADQDALLDAFTKGEIEYLATDHAPHTKEEKLNGTSGMPGLDTYATLVGWLWQEVGVDPKILASACSRNPGQFTAKFLETWKLWFPSLNALGHGYGELAKGYSASFTVLHKNKPITISNNSVKTKVGWSPFDGHRFKSSLEAVFLNGYHANL